MGSYAKINKNPFSISFQDIYVPDGQINGHVQPPAPIQQAFGQGWYKLRDANWDPNFPTSAKTIRWFFEKGKEINPDVLIAINLSTIERILKITGPIAIEPLGITLESSNISLVLQNNIQENFFPGSTNKKDLITSAGQTLTQKFFSLSTRQKFKIVKTLYQDLKNQEILINATDSKLQAFLEKKDLAGQLKPTPCSNPRGWSWRTPGVSSCLSDTVAIVESNLGSNKANGYVTRNTTHTVSRGPTLAGATPDIGGAGPLGQKAEGGSNPNENFITHQITIEYTNTSPSENPEPPNHHGGNYINYLRFYIPLSATNILIFQGPTLAGAATAAGPLGQKAEGGSNPEINNNHNFQEIGFFHTTPFQATSSTTISYQLPIKGFSSDSGPAGTSSDVAPINYQLSILKQPGIINSPQTMNIFGKTQTTNLSTNYISNNIKLHL